MEVKGKAHPVALSLLINTSSETSSTANGSGTEKGISQERQLSILGDLCVDIGQIWLQGWRGVCSWSWGGWVSPWGCGTARVRWCTAGLGAASGPWVVFTLSRLHISPWDLSSTTIFVGPSVSPHPTPLLKQRFQQRRPNKSFAVQRKPPRAGTRQIKFPRCLPMGTQPFIPISDLHKITKHLFFSLLLEVMMLLGLQLGLSIPAQEQTCSQESVPDVGRSHQGVVAAVLGVHGCGGVKEASNNHGRAREPWLGLSMLRQRKKKRSGEKPLSSAEGIRIYCHIRWIRVNEKLRPDFISADNKISSSHN